MVEEEEEEEEEVSDYEVDGGEIEVEEFFVKYKTFVRIVSGVHVTNSFIVTNELIKK